MPARLCAAAVGALVLGLLFSPAAARDGDDVRGYLGIRAFGSNPGTGVRDYYGASVGANINRFLGAELSGDFFERRIDVDAFGSVGEQGITAIVPQIRLRYPVFDGRLTPYLIAGAGVAITEFNDRKAGTFGRSVDANRALPVGAVGGGIEYFLSDSVALGVEVKYLIGGDNDVKIDGVKYSNSIDSLIATFAMRLFYPERPGGEGVVPRADAPRRLYLGLRLGGAIVTDPDVSSELEIRPEPPAIGPLNQYFGASIGLDIGRHWGIELAFEGYETTIELKGRGSITEYAVYGVVPQARFRYPVLDGRLVPYLLAGVGVASGEVNDRKPQGVGVEVRASESIGVAATVGVGLEYLVTRHVAVGAEAKYLYTHGLTLKLAGGEKHDANLNPVFLSLGLRVYLTDF
jgi:opacity protein-like surface antigen